MRYPHGVLNPSLLAASTLANLPVRALVCVQALAELLRRSSLGHLAPALVSAQGLQPSRAPSAPTGRVFGPLCGQAALPSQPTLADCTARYARDGRTAFLAHAKGALAVAKLADRQALATAVAKAAREPPPPSPPPSPTPPTADVRAGHGLRL